MRGEAGFGSGGESASGGGGLHPGACAAQCDGSNSFENLTQCLQAADEHHKQKECREYADAMAALNVPPVSNLPSVAVLEPPLIQKGKAVPAAPSTLEARDVPVLDDKKSPLPLARTPIEDICAQLLGKMNDVSLQVKSCEDKLDSRVGTLERQLEAQHKVLAEHSAQLTSIPELIAAEVSKQVAARPPQSDTASFGASLRSFQQNTAGFQAGYLQVFGLAAEQELRNGGGFTKEDFVELIGRLADAKPRWKTYLRSPESAVSSRFAIPRSFTVVLAAPMILQEAAAAAVELEVFLRQEGFTKASVKTEDPVAALLRNQLQAMIGFFRGEWPLNDEDMQYGLSMEDARVVVRPKQDGGGVGGYVSWQPVVGLDRRSGAPFLMNGFFQATTATETEAVEIQEELAERIR